jgi:hypothetical protein
MSSSSNNIDESLIEKAFEREYIKYLGFSYKCKLCNTIIKSALDAWLHLRNYHSIKTLDDYKAHEDLRKTMNEMPKQQDQNHEEKKQEQNDKIITIIKKVVKPKQITLLQFFKGDNK